MTNFTPVNPKQSFPELEKQIINFWKENNTFKKSIETRANSEEFAFYDGPPFATGTPHYGHLLGGTMKDVIPRYQTMKWKKVDRVFGWDCHWLPIENIVEKKMDISGRDDIEKIGVHNFNEECRANVFGYTDEWKQVVERMWRWVDIETPYRTMDKEFMESVWWVYKNLYYKGLIYEGHRVVPYCPRCATPLSNFEVNQWYKDKQDKTATVKFKVKGNDNKYILAWTTTPWTLVANLGLAVWKDIDYAELSDKKTWETYILAKDRISSYYKNEEDYSIVREYKGACLQGIKYEPIFNDFEVLNDAGILPNGMSFGKNTYWVVIGHHVTTESGTGIVHIAPAFWEDDYIIGQESDLGFVSHIDDAGKTNHLLEDNWMLVFDFNEKALQTLKDENATVLINTVDHSYPHCWRCDTPLIYRAISAWYVAVEKIRDKLVKNNKWVNWVPEIIKEGRFGTWLEWARDWNISRNRYWGSAIPVWQNTDKSEEICIGSIEELYELNKDFGQIEKRDGSYFFTESGKEIDIHKHFVDEIKIKNPSTGNTLTRIPEVLDCWFESGAMPYASKHYPFENEQDFKFPADFIAEGLDQTRGWFYTLLILGTALFDKSPYKNVIVNGIVLAEDGKKMSKRLQNYPDPSYIMDKYGADAMRFYLMNSPVVEAQDLRFSEAWVEEVVKKVILPLWNTYYFFTTYANIDKFKPEVWNIYFVRHGQTDNNKNGIVNGWNDNLDLNETGIRQSHALGKQIKAAWIKFDAIITSPMDRAKNTASIIASYLEDIKIIEEEWLTEQSYWEFRGMSHDEIMEKHNCKTLKDLQKTYRNNLEENVEQFDNRVEITYKNIEEKYKHKNVLVVAHGWTFRAINRYLNNHSVEEAFYEIKSAKNGKLYKLANYKKTNKLDKWIVSELHKLIKEVSNWFDDYKLNDAARPIAKFMDNLTNWYIRRSRKRFWKSESDNDKIEAYNTLYDILVETTKIIAPFMPFVSEYIYKELTWKESVHLDLFPEAVDWFILDNLNNDTDKVQKIITLGLAWRANHKIRVRQPLSSVTIWEELENYYLDIIKEELNVKEVNIVDPSSLARKICKPNGRNIWPKFGKDVKFIMNEAKTWNFKELENWNIKVWDFELEAGDFEIVFEAGDSNYDIEAWFGMVIALDPNISEELKLEWYARDIVRHIQEARKEAEYNVDDRIQINLNWEIINDDFINLFWNYIQSETLSTINNDLRNSDLEKEIELEDIKINLKLKK